MQQTGTPERTLTWTHTRASQERRPANTHHCGTPTPLLFVQFPARVQSLADSRRRRGRSCTVSIGPRFTIERQAEKKELWSRASRSQLPFVLRSSVLRRRAPRLLLRHARPNTRPFECLNCSRRSPRPSARPMLPAPAADTTSVAAPPRLAAQSAAPKAREHSVWRCAIRSNGKRAMSCAKS